MASNSSTLLPGQSPPLTIITPDNHSGIILIAAALGLIFACLSLLIRIFIRLEFRHDFAKDDLVAGVAGIFAAFQTTSVIVAVSKGLGKSMDEISPTNLIELQKAAYVSDILYILTLWFTKCSVAFLFLRLSPDKGHTVTSNMTLLVSTVVMFVSVLIIALRCDFNQPWIFMEQKCPNLFARWATVAAFDVLTEIMLFSTSIYMVKSLQLSLKKKVVVVFAFGLRVPIIAPILVRLHYLSTEFDSSNPTLASVLAVSITQIQLSYAIIAATTPCLRPFMSALSTHYGAPAQSKTTPQGTYYSGTARSGQDISLSKVSKLSTNRSTNETSKPRERSRVEYLGTSDESGTMTMGNPVMRWDQAEHHAEVVGGEHDQRSVRSDESKQMIISKNTQWAVEFEGTDHDAESHRR